MQQFEYVLCGGETAHIGPGKAIADGDVDFLREGVRVLAQAVMEAEVTERTGGAPRRAQSGAAPDQPERVSRSTLGHPGGHHDLAIPRVRDGYFPSLLEYKGS